jgi:hypothetical protein
MVKHPFKEEYDIPSARRTRDGTRSPTKSPRLQTPRTQTPRQVQTPRQGSTSSTPREQVFTNHAELQVSKLSAMPSQTKADRPERVLYLFLN